MPGRIELFGIGILSWVTWLPGGWRGCCFCFLIAPRTTAFVVRECVDRAVFFDRRCPLVTGLGGTRYGYDKALRRITVYRGPRLDSADRSALSAWRRRASLVLVMLTTLLGVVAVVCSWSYIREKGREKEYYIMMLLLQSGMIGAFVSADMFLFFIFWEVMLVPMYFLIGIWGGKNRLYSAIKFFLYTLVGSVVMLLAVLKLFFIFPEWSKRSDPRLKQPRDSLLPVASPILNDAARSTVRC